MTQHYLSKGAALIRIDVQNDFVRGGALAVPGGEDIVEPLNVLSHHAARGGCLVVDTQDWHPLNHKSFASNHEGRKPFETIEMSYGDQTLWPAHCIRGYWGSELYRIDTTMSSLLIRKGMNPDIDSYSAFFENDHKTQTGLAGYLRERGVTKVFLAGLAYDFCVGYSALDAASLGFETVVLRNLCRAIDMDGSEAAMTQKLLNVGVHIVESGTVLHVK
jgi:nicotinamidase/pyrazinamidase